MIRMFYLCGFSVLLQALLTAAAEEESCSGPNKVIKTNKDEGRLSSNNSSRDTNCTWLITARKGYCVQLCIKKLTCDHCDLSIWDEKYPSKHLLKKMCAQTFEHWCFSSRRNLRVQFSQSQNDRRDKSGFVAEYKVVKKAKQDRLACSAARRRFYFMYHYGSLASYNYPKPYDKAIECFWQFRINSDYKIILSFKVFNLSSSDGCSNDYVEVDGQRFCGLKKPFTVTMKNSNSRNSHVTFVSNGKRKYPGFEATFVARRKTTTVLKLVGIFVGGIAALCVFTFLCYKCVTTDPEEDETENETVVTEWDPETTRDKENVI